MSTFICLFCLPQSWLCGEPQDCFPTDPGPSTSKPSDKMLISSVVPNWYLIPISISVNIDSFAIELLQNRLTFKVYVSSVHSSSTVFPEFVSPDLQEEEGKDEDPLSLNRRRFLQTCSDGNNARGSRVFCSVLNVPRSRHWFSDRSSDDPSSGTNRGLIFDLILDTWCLILEMGSDLGMIPAE